MEIRTYTPHTNLRKPWILIREIVRDIYQGQDLAYRLTIRDIKAIYRQSFLGILWAFILPIANTLVWLFLNSTGIVAMGNTGIPYSVYVFSGTMIWAIFMESMQAPLDKTIQNKSILAKVNFPREAIIMASVYQSLFNAGIKILILLCALVIMGFVPGWTVILFPLGVLSLVLTGTVIGLLLTPLGILYSDVSKGIPLVMQFLMYTTPVVYALPSEGTAAKIVHLNPLTPLVVTTRDWLTGVEPLFLNGFILISILVFVFMFVFLLAYRLAMPILVERMNA